MKKRGLGILLSVLCSSVFLGGCSVLPFEEKSLSLIHILPLRDVVFNTLRQAILKGELKPGERLMEIALAEKLGVSRTPIREAMRKLELEGLVVMIPRRGAQVANITEKDLNDVLEVRIALENVAIEKACTRMSKEDMGRLWLAAKEFERTMAEGNLCLLYTSRCV